MAWANACAINCGWGCLKRPVRSFVVMVTMPVKRSTAGITGTVGVAVFAGVSGVFVARPALRPLFAPYRAERATQRLLRDATTATPPRKGEAPPSNFACFFVPAYEAGVVTSSSATRVPATRSVQAFMTAGSVGLLASETTT